MTWSTRMLTADSLPSPSPYLLSVNFQETANRMGTRRLIPESGFDESAASSPCNFDFPYAFRGLCQPRL
jgi:hypothetical protein